MGFPVFSPAVALVLFEAPITPNVLAVRRTAKRLREGPKGPKPGTDVLEDVRQVSRSAMVNS